MTTVIGSTEASPQVFVTVATQRSGTKALGSAMNAGGCVTSLGELLTTPGDQEQPGFADRLRAALASRSSFQFLRDEIHELLDEVLAGYARSVTRPFLHFDIMYNQLRFLSPLWETVYGVDDCSALLSYLTSRDIPVIHLVRLPEDCVRSEVNMALTGIAHVGRDGVEYKASTPPWGELPEDFSAMPAWAGRRVGQINYWRRMVHSVTDGTRTLTLRFEDLFEEDRISDAVASDIADLLGRRQSPELWNDRHLLGSPAFLKGAPLPRDHPLRYDAHIAVEWPWDGRVGHPRSAVSPRRPF